MTEVMVLDDSPPIGKSLEEAHIADEMSLGLAMEKTGADQFLAEHIISITGHYGPIAVLAGFFIMTVALTQADVKPGCRRATGKLSATMGITVASENMVYVWGNYNTNGIKQAPGSGTASINDPAATSRFTGAQVPASIVADDGFN